MAIYKVVLNGQCQGQDIKNILYYRNGIGIDLSGLTVGGTVEVADAVKAIVWPAMRPIMPTAYELQDITAYVYDESNFNLLYQNPTIVGVEQSGTLAGDLNGPATCAIFRFSLEPTSILLNGIKPPKRGYLAIGPMTDSRIDNEGKLTNDVDVRAQYAITAFALANNVETLIPPAVFFPIRVHQQKVLGLFKIVSFADIRDCVVRVGTSYRRSRMPES
jgi:hypothetical protein